MMSKLIQIFIFLQGRDFDNLKHGLVLYLHALSILSTVWRSDLYLKPRQTSIIMEM